jgi:hypothetical protein
MSLCVDSCRCENHDTKPTPNASCNERKTSEQKSPHANASNASPNRCEHRPGLRRANESARATRTQHIECRRQTARHSEPQKARRNVQQTTHENQKKRAFKNRDQRRKSKRQQNARKKANKTQRKTKHDETHACIAEPNAGSRSLSSNSVSAVENHVAAKNRTQNKQRKRKKKKRKRKKHQKKTTSNTNDEDTNG